MFDIDLTDYDDVRTCGKEGHICAACWPLMAVAVEVGTLTLQGRPMSIRPAATLKHSLLAHDSPTRVLLCLRKDRPGSDPLWSECSAVRDGLSRAGS